MDGELLGEVLYEGISATNGPVFSPWFPREGNTALFGVQIMEVSGCTLYWSVQTKNTEDPDPVASDVLFSYRSVSTITTDTTSVEPNSGTYAAGILELVRYVIKTGDTPSNDWVYCRVLAPAWHRN